GLEAAAQWLIERTEQRSRLTCRLSVTGDLKNLDDRVATAAFRVLQEALTNVVRHAEAQAVEVEIAAQKSHLELRISDDGIGLTPARARANRSGSHVGLIGMRERGHALGGQLEIRERAANLGHGTVVHCQLPLALPAAESGD